MDDNGSIYDDQGVLSACATRSVSMWIRTPPTTTSSPSGLPLPPEMDISYESERLVFQLSLLFDRAARVGVTVQHLAGYGVMKGDHYIVPDQTLIEAGATVTVTEGTQLQFGTSNPSNPYTSESNPYLQVEGLFLTMGTFEEPIEFFGLDLLIIEKLRLGILVQLGSHMSCN